MVFIRFNPMAVMHHQEKGIFDMNDDDNNNDDFYAILKNFVFEITFGSDERQSRNHWLMNIRVVRSLLVYDVRRQ